MLPLWFFDKYIYKCYNWCYDFFTLMLNWYSDDYDVTQYMESTVLILISIKVNAIGISCFGIDVRFEFFLHLALIYMYIWI